MGKAETLGEAACERPLARSGGPVDGDDKGPGEHYSPVIVPPRPLISPIKPGKLVATGAASSIRTGSLAARPKMRKAIAMRWSSRVAISAPPAGKLPAPSTI